MHFANTFSEMRSTSYEAKYVEKIQQIGRVVRKLLLTVKTSLSLIHSLCGLFWMFDTPVRDFVASLPWKSKRS